MANKRNLKKHVKYVCGDLAGECIVARNFIPGINAGQMDNIIYDIAELQTSTIMRVTFSYDKVVADFENKHTYHVARSKYFKEAYAKLIADFNAGVDNVVKQMNGALPQAQKDANKQAVKA